MLTPLGMPTAGLVTEAMMSDCAIFWQAVHWKSRAVSLIRFCMLNGSRTAVKPSSLMRRITFTMSAGGKQKSHMASLPAVWIQGVKDIGAS